MLSINNIAKKNEIMHRNQKAKNIIYTMVSTYNR